MKVVIIDYDMGNIKSVLRAFENFTSNVVISRNPQDLQSASHIVLPGVGSFNDGMDKLIKFNFVETIKTEVTKNKIPFLGICVGMQLLATTGDEGGKKDGLNLINGEVTKFIPQKNEPVPHVGWNEIHKKQDHEIVKDIKNGTDFYFVHSYYFNCHSSKNIVATTPYLGEFPSIIADKNIIGVQFHPEKSQVAGFKIIKNFLEI